jgi:hypothetical protein
MKTKLLIALTVGLAWTVGGGAFAANPPGTGQPGVECEDFGTHPGRAASAPGSPFNENGVSGQHYAGTQPQNSKPPHSSSQYDVACFQQSARISHQSARPTFSHGSGRGR